MTSMSRPRPLDLRHLMAGGLAALLATAALADGRVLDVNGPVTRQGSRGAEPLHMLDRLQTQDIVVTGPQGTATLIIDGSGAQFALQGPGRWQLTATGLQTLEGSAPRALGVAAPNLRPLPAGTRAMAGATAMRNGEAANLALQPDAARLLAVPAALQWRDAGTGARYKVQLATAAGDQVLDTTVDAPRAALSALPLLVPGGSYAWAVEVLSGPRRGTRAHAAFSVADAATQQQWAALKPGADDPVSQWVLYAHALEGAGFADAAAQAWATVQARRPDLLPAAR